PIARSAAAATDAILGLTLAARTTATGNIVVAPHEPTVGWPDEDRAGFHRVPIPEIIGAALGSEWGREQLAATASSRAIGRLVRYGGHLLHDFDVGVVPQNLGHFGYRDEAPQRAP